MGPSTNERVFVERTLALIKPDALHKAEDIEEIIVNSGFLIVQKRRVHLSPEQCSEFYADQYGKPYFSSLTTFMSSGPVLAFTLAREHAVTHWKSIIGPASVSKARETQPGCIRAIYGTTDLHNAVHGSESSIAAQREIKYIFPNTTTEPFPTKQEIEVYLKRHVFPVLLQGLTELCKHKPLDPCLWLADWLMRNNPNQILICSGVTTEE